MPTANEHTEAEQSLLDHLRIMGELFTYVSLVQQWGRLWPAQALPEGYCRGTPQHCFANAFDLAVNHDELTYVEGYAQSAYLVNAHAWVVDPDGQVIDPTWNEPERRAYLGVAFSTDFLAEVVEQGYYGLISTDWQRHNRMLDQGFVTKINDVGLTVVTGLG